MNRRSNTVKLPKYCLVKFDVDQQKGVVASSQIKTKEFGVGEKCDAPYKKDVLPAEILAMHGMLMTFVFSFYYIS